MLLLSLPLFCKSKVILNFFNEKGGGNIFASHILPEGVYLGQESILLSQRVGVSTT